MPKTMTANCRRSAVIMGPRSPHLRHDILGELSELLSSSIGDHLPDRYIAAFA
jgi:hypothetical protein